MPRRFTKWVLVTHARQRQGERLVSNEQIEQAVQGPDRVWEQGKGARGGVKWVFEKSFSGDTLRVIGEIAQETLYIVTVFWIK